MMELKYTITPVEGKDLIGYEIEAPGFFADERQRIAMHIASLAEEVVRSQLIKAGWTPPGEQSAIARKDALLERALDALSYCEPHCFDNRDGFKRWSEVMPLLRIELENAK